MKHLYFYFSAASAFLSARSLRPFDPPRIAHRKRNMMRMPTGRDTHAAIVRLFVARAMPEAIRYVMAEITAQDIAYGSCVPT